MKVKGKVSVCYHESSINEEVQLSVKFKLPDQRFYRKRTTTIANSWWERSRVGYDYLQDAANKLQDKEYLEEMAKELIVEYIKNKYSQTDYHKNKRKVKELIKAVDKNFEVEVEYKLSK